MSVSNILNAEFPLHEVSINMINTIKFAVLIMGLIKFLLLQILLHRKMISGFISAFPTRMIFDRDDSTTKNMDTEKRVVDNDEIVCRGEMEMVLRSLGISCQEKLLPARLDTAGIFDIFEEREPSLDEVREAFDVFDDNRDGFIDENELQRVVCALGFKKGLKVENCRRMIGAFDEDGDGKIDFQEFVKFMENSFA
ncbi:hypothetical protein C2S52_002491 [Perilla frutescens var. hirtella]|nr:hypothetical protein C2S52_002491 [Perilla frutescens var. hirtella]